MEHYYLLAAICCALLFILSRILLALRTRDPVNNTMLKEYDYDPYNTAIFPDPLLKRLKKVNRLNTDNRQPDEMDAWFKQATPQLMHNGNCLLYIDHFGHLEDTFWKNVEELNLHPEQDKKFQQLLFSCHHVGNYDYWLNNFSNMLFYFGYNYDTLSPEIENIINTDKRLKSAKRVYYRAREFANEEKNNK